MEQSEITHECLCAKHLRRGQELGIVRSIVLRSGETGKQPYSKQLMAAWGNDVGLWCEPGRELAMMYLKN